MNDDKGNTYCMVMETTVEDNDTPMLMMPDAPWIGINFLFTEDITSLQETNPEMMAGGPEFGPEDNLISVVMNNLSRDVARDVLQRLLQTLEDSE